MSHNGIDSAPAQLLRLEQIRLLYAAMPVTIIATLINASVLLYFEWNAVEHRLLLTWFGALFLITGTRLMLTLAFFRSRPGIHGMKSWESYFIGGAISAAITWGCASFILFPPDSIAHQVFLAFIIGGMAAGSITSLSPLRITVFAFLFLTLLPLSIRFFMLGSELTVAMGILTLLFLVLTSANALKSHQTIVQNIALRLESAERERAIRRSERKLRESEETYHGIFNSLQESVYIQDEQGRFLDVNEGAIRMYGYPRERFIGETPEFLSAPEHNDLTQIAALVDKAFHGEAQQFEFWGLDASGREFPKDVRVYPGEYFGQKAVIAIAQDISDKRMLESRLLQSQKMEAIGRLVGGIAHDFNNTLAAIMGNLHLARLKIDQRQTLTEKLDNIDKLSAHATAIVQQLLTFARRDMVETGPVALTSFLKEQIRLAETIVPKNIELSFDLCEEELHTTGNPVQLQQVLMNLLNNARDALAATEQPKITCSIRPFKPTPAFCRKHPDITADRFALLSLSDNGSGIPAAIREHIFEPFFTTKEVGKGTGLGLATTYGAVQTHKGILEVESSPGQGTTFLIYLPLLDAARAGRPEETGSHWQGIRKGHGETILLADDEEALIDSMQEVLEHYGYRVLTARDGEQAIATFTAHRDRIDLAILDVVMPGLDGSETARRIRESDLSTPIIFITGYDKEYALGQREPIRHSLILRKPVPVEMLTHSIEKMLRTSP
jgi:PAS domain S-box-containing protein